jgi:hypothetical protein
MKSLVAGFAMLALCSHADAAPLKQYQSCSGRLIYSETEGAWQLERTERSGLWCDAWISASFGKALPDRVLRACKVNERCQIKGTFVGRGVFYWRTISEVKPAP